MNERKRQNITLKSKWMQKNKKDRWISMCTDIILSFVHNLTYCFMTATNLWNEEKKKYKMK